MLGELAKRKGVALEARGRPFGVKSCSYVFKHSAQVCSIKCGWVSEGKRAISIARKLKGQQRNFTGEHFWARGYFVSTVGFDEDMVLEYIRSQEKADEHQDQLRFGL